QIPGLCQCCDHHNCFRPGKSLSDAAPGTSPEWKIRVLVARGSRFRRPTVGIKTKRVGEKTLIMMRDVRTHDEDGTGRNYVRSELVVFEGAAAHDPCRRV